MLLRRGPGAPRTAQLTKATNAQTTSRVRGLRDTFRGPLIKFGAIKGMLDGTVDARTAAMIEPVRRRRDRHSLLGTGRPRPGRGPLRQGRVPGPAARNRRQGDPHGARRIRVRGEDQRHVGTAASHRARRGPSTRRSAPLPPARRHRLDAGDVRESRRDRARELRRAAGPRARSHGRLVQAVRRCGGHAGVRQRLGRVHFAPLRQSTAASRA